MAAWTDMGRGGRALVLGGGAAAIALVAALIWVNGPPMQVVQKPVAVQQPVATETVGTVTTDKTAAADATAAAVPQSEPSAAPDTGAAVPSAKLPVAESVAVAAPAPTTAPEAIAIVPAFDVVRVAPDGSALVAGRAEAGSSVSVRVDGVEAMAVIADGLGKFVALFTLAPSGAPRVMTLATPEAGGERASADQVVIAPIAEPAPVAIVSAEGTTQTPSPKASVAEPASETAMQPDPTAEPASNLAPTVPAASGVAIVADPATPPAATATLTVEAALGDEPAAPAAVLLTKDGARVLQTGSAASAGPRNVTIDAISYSASGAVQLAGRGDAGSVVRLYIDNLQVLDTAIGSDGTWGGTLPEITAGLYTLRADQVNAQGRVQSRYETPFQREAPDVLAAATPDLAAGVPVAPKITVQPGFTLWGIASNSYGDGVKFVQVYEANKALIRDPDLIYPGQVFIVPAEN